MQNTKTMINLKISFLAIFIFCWVSSTLGQWTNITPISTTQWYNSTYFTNKDYGFVVGRYWNGFTATGMILRTTDGGINWNINYTDTMPELRTVFFVNNNLGFIGGDGGKLYKTNDGGINWLFLNSTTNSKIDKIYFLDANVGFITADRKLFKTTDGGSIWTLQLISNNALLSIIFIDNQTGFICGCFPNSGIGPPYYPTILKTSDGGISWVQTTLTGQYCLSSISFPTTSKGYSMGSGGTFAYTLNTGSNWTQNNISGYYGVNGMIFTDTLSGYAAGRDYAFNQQGFIIKTTDGGSNWTNDLIDTVPALNDIFFPTDKVGYAVGGSGTFGVILKLDKETFIPKIINETKCFELEEIFPNPVAVNLTLKFLSNNSKIITLNIFNSIGQLILSSQFIDLSNQSETIKEIDISSFSKGLYFLKLNSNCNQSMNKIIIE